VGTKAASVFIASILRFKQGRTTLNDPGKTMERAMGGLLSAVREETCPFCFDRFRLSATPFRCSSLPQKCAWTPDIVLRGVWDDATPVGRCIDATGSFQTEAACPDCKTPSRHRLCPKCHQQLPSAFAERRNYVFSVIGARNSGKSHFITTAIETFKHERGPRIGLNIRPSDDKASKRYNRELFEPLYKARQTIDATRTAAARAESALPLVFSATLSRAGLMRKSVISGACVLSFFDTPGEDLESEANVSNLTRYVFNSDGIIVLIDPMEFDYVRDRLPDAALTPSSQNSDPIEIISRVADIIRLHTGVAAKTKIKIPIAITMSKIDALDSLIDSSSPLRQRAPNSERFARNDCDAASLDMRTLLATWLSPYIVQSVEDNFETVKYFGVSALGSTPKGGRVASIEPHRVTSPFEWLLYQHGLLRAEDKR
jgi:hypothetical protein